MTVVETNHSSTLSDGSIDGFERSDSVWRLNLDHYGEFIESITGITPEENLSASDCYRIGNRLEAFIDESQRAGEWTEELVEKHPEVDSLRQLYVLARFFRRCHEQCLEA